MKCEKVSQAFRIPCYMFDRNERFRPASFLDVAQELAAVGSEQLHFADSDLAKYNLVWILARMDIIFDRLPLRGESTTIQTWHCGLQGICFRRDYRMLDAEGAPCIRSTSSWAVMDMDERKVVRGDRLAAVIDTEGQEDDLATDEACAKIVVPRDLAAASVTEHRAVYSDLDYNGHVNNARYAVWAMDCLPLELSCGMAVRRFSINFNNEVRSGETVRLTHFPDGDVHYVEGRVGEVQSFVCRIILE